eukprot:6003460-Amphidinium_carterae.1
MVLVVGIVFSGFRTDHGVHPSYSHKMNSNSLQKSHRNDGQSQDDVDDCITKNSLMVRKTHHRVINLTNAMKQSRPQTYTRAHRAICFKWRGLGLQS